MTQLDDISCRGWGEWYCEAEEYEKRVVRLERVLLQVTLALRRERERVVRGPHVRTAYVAWLDELLRPLDEEVVECLRDALEDESSAHD